MNYSNALAVQPNNYYVYGLINPIDNQIFYIGKGNRDRVLRHYTNYHMTKKSHKNNIIKAYKAMGLNNKYVILKDNMTKGQALDLEFQLIEKLGRRITNTGILANVKPGEVNNILDSQYDKEIIKLAEDTIDKFTENLENYGRVIQQTKINKFEYQKGSKSRFYKVVAWDPKFRKLDGAALASWYYSIEIRDFCFKNPNFTLNKIQKYMKDTFEVQFSIQSIKNITIYLKKGWNPEKDESWIKFKSTVNINRFSIYNKLVVKRKGYWLNIKAWSHPRATTESKNTWYLSNKIYNLYLDNPTKGYVYFKNLCDCKLKLTLNRKSMQNMLRYFKSGWVPEQDPDWLKFKQEFKYEQK